jgi:putative oxidoreductase
MISKLLSQGTYYFGIDIIRIITGGIIISYGLEIMNSKKMAGYIEWLNDVKVILPETMAYIGKFSELIFGLFLLLGFLTRLSSIPLIITMFVVTFIMLKGEIDSSSFYLLLLFTCFLFTGSGKISIDYLIRKKKSN